jgi:hypothetical protein
LSQCLRGEKVSVPKNPQPAAAADENPTAGAPGLALQLLPPWLASYMASSSRLQIPSVSKVLHSWTFITSPLVPMMRPISQLVRPSQIATAT